MPSEPQTSAPASATTDSQPHLRRVLGLWDLVFYGIVLIQPVAAVGIFGKANQISEGHITTAILLAMIAMMLTAVSYGRMATHFPVAGSAYTYVGRAFHPHLGFVVGWAMFLDYLIIPVISIAYGTISLQQLMPGTKKWDAAIGHALHLPDTISASYMLIVIALVGLITFLNLRGVRWAARTNEILLAIMTVVIVIFLIDIIRFLIGHGGPSTLFSSEPFYNPKTFQWKTVFNATSIAALTYIGFDGITTLSEEVKDPKRTVGRATVLVCLLTGIICGVQVYLAQLAWPDYSTYSNQDNAFFDVCGRVGGLFLSDSFAVIMFIACFGSALTGQMGAARVLFAMGRDNALPKSWFGRVNSRTNQPSANIWIIGGVALAITLSLKYGDAVSILNYGALIAFMGVNLAVIAEFMFRKPAGYTPNPITDFVLPFLGFASCAAIWFYLDPNALKYGTIWLVVGILLCAIKTRCFTRKPVMIDLSGA